MPLSKYRAAILLGHAPVKKSVGRYNFEKYSRYSKYSNGQWSVRLAHKIMPARTPFQSPQSVFQFPNIETEEEREFNESRRFPVPRVLFSNREDDTTIIIRELSAIMVEQEQEIANLNRLNWDQFTDIQRLNRQNDNFRRTLRRLQTRAPSGQGTVEDPIDLTVPPPIEVIDLTGVELTTEDGQDMPRGPMDGAPVA